MCEEYIQQKVVTIETKTTKEICVGKGRVNLSFSLNIEDPEQIHDFLDCLEETRRILNKLLE